jgi:RNase P subunit RPR2
MPTKKQPKPEPREWTYCQKCDLPYTWMRCRVTFYPNGKKVDWCLKCGTEWEIERDKKKKLP